MVKNSNSLNLFIDAFFIINLYGINNVATNPDYLKKKCSKLSIISDEKKNILSVGINVTHLTKYGI